MPGIERAALERDRKELDMERELDATTEAVIAGDQAHPWPTPRPGNAGACCRSWPDRRARTASGGGELCA
jgi:hypothetical protein